MKRSNGSDQDPLHTAYREFRALADEALAISETLDSDYDPELSQRLKKVWVAMDAALERYKKLLNALEP